MFNVRCSVFKFKVQGSRFSTSSRFFKMAVKIKSLHLPAANIFSPPAMRVIFKIKAPGLIPGLWSFFYFSLHVVARLQPELAFAVQCSYSVVFCFDAILINAAAQLVPAFLFLCDYLHHVWLHGVTCVVATVNTDHKVAR